MAHERLEEAIHKQPLAQSLQGVLGGRRGRGWAEVQRGARARRRSRRAQVVTAARRGLVRRGCSRSRRAGTGTGAAGGDGGGDGERTSRARAADRPSHVVRLRQERLKHACVRVQELGAHDRLAERAVRQAIGDRHRTRVRQRTRLLRELLGQLDVVVDLCVIANGIERTTQRTR